jgi:hypothetical protein
MNDLKITNVRHTPPEADALLHSYVFEGRYGGPRVPRGIALPQVTLFVKTAILPDVDSADLFRLLEVLRFYERADCVEHLLKFLVGKELDNTDIQRSLLLVQIAGDIGEAPEAKQAAAYLDDRLVEHPAMTGEFALLFQTLLTLAPYGSMAKSEARLATQLKRAESQKDANEQGLRAFTLLTTADAERKRTAKLRAAKTKLAALPPDKRVTELLAVYLGESSLSTSYMEVWAARMLRREAFDNDPTAVLRDLGHYLDRALPAGAKAPGEPFHYVRAAQALVYLGGSLPLRHKTAYHAIEDKTLNFLWDDPPEPPGPKKAREPGKDAEEED